MIRRLSVVACCLGALLLIRLLDRPLRFALSFSLLFLFFTGPCGSQVQAQPVQTQSDPPSDSAVKQDSTKSTAASTPWNFLLMLGDDTSYHDLGCYGSPNVKTPHIDQLSEQSLRFEFAFNTAPMCAPTRMALYTGIYPVRNGAYPNHSAVYPDVRSLPHYLQPLGYSVALLGKRHYRPVENFPFEYLGGRDHDGGKGLDLDLDVARQFIQRHTEDPWCLVVASNQAHTPWTRGNPAAYQPKDLQLPDYLVDTPKTRQALTKYYAEITYLDQQVGTMLEILQESGQADRTVVVFLSEQGSNLPFAKWTCYEAGLRSAALFRVPGMTKAGSTTPALMQYIDVLPTFIELAGGTVPADTLDGRSLVPVLKGDTDQHHPAVFGVQTSRGIIRGPEAFGIRSVRNDRYRLVWNLNHQSQFQNTVTEGGGPAGVFDSWKRQAEKGNAEAAKAVERYRHRPEFELYDVQADPWNQHNLIQQPELQGTVQDLKNQLDAWMTQQGDLGVETELKALERIPGKSSGTKDSASQEDGD